MNTTEKKRFSDFKNAVLNLEMVDNDTMYILINRYTWDNRTRHFFSEKNRLKYYGFWVKMLHEMGVLTPAGPWGIWKVNKPIITDGLSTPLKYGGDA